MQLTPVESSHVAAIGYLEAERVLLVRYKDGSLYAQPGWNSVAWDQLQRAQSKGKAIKACAVPMILITKGVMPSDPPTAGSSVAEPGGNAALSPGPLNVIDEDADKCCRAYLARNLAGIPDDPVKNTYGYIQPAYTCQHCGTEFRAEMVGPNRYWRIVPQVHIHRPR